MKIFNSFIILCLATLACRQPQPVGPIDPRTMVIGEYEMNDTVITIMNGTKVINVWNSYTMRVNTRGTVRDTFYLENIFNNSTVAYAIISGNTFVIPKQNMNGISPATNSGSGTFEAGKINFRLENTNRDYFIDGQRK
jgi:hypothetical protein